MYEREHCSVNSAHRCTVFTATSMDQRSGLACPCAHLTKKLVDLLRHIRLLHFGTPGFTSLKCNLDGCQRTFRKFTVFRNHIYQIHSDSQLLQLAPETDTRTPSPSPFVHDDDPPHFYPELDGLSSESDEDDTSSSPSGYDIDRGILSMQKAAAIWILKTQEVCKLPQSTTAKIMEDVGSLYESALVNIHAHVSSLLKESGISAETIPDLSAIFSPDGIHGSLFRGLETHARQLQYYKSHLQFVVSDNLS